MDSTALMRRVDHALEQIQTIDDAKLSSDILDRILLVAKQDGYSLQMQNMLALKRIDVQREGGVLLKEIAANADVQSRTTDGKFESETYLPDGLSRQEAHRWRKLAEIPDGDIAEFAESMMIRGKEITQSSVLKLAAKENKNDKNSGFEPPRYAAPGIDTQLAREFGLEASDAIAGVILMSVNNALISMDNPRHSYVWTRYHGISDTGEMGAQWSYEGIGAKMGTSREYVEGLYYRASHRVLLHVILDLVNQIRILLAADR